MEIMSTLQTGQAEARAPRPHAGWSAAENALLFEQAARAQAEGAPLKAVFDDVARQTGRRPNSVRNYYYARVKEGDGGAYRHTPAFIPFTEAETRALLEAVLSAQAAGESVRACTLRLGEGDQSAMLRYQNKYRSLIRSKPALVRSVLSELAGRSVLEDMAGRGVPAFDPYARGDGRRAGRPRKQEQRMAAADVVSRLEQVEGLDVQAFLSALGTLALQAVRGGAAADGGADEAPALREQLQQQQERYDALCAAFRSLVRINTDFLRQAAVVRTGDLTDYLRALEASLRPCEQLLAE